VKKIGRSKEQEQSAEQLRLPLRELVREALFDTVIVSPLEYVGEVLEEERTALCGPRYQHDPRRQALRAGSVPSSLSLGGQRVEVERPRAPQRGWTRVELAELESMECARSAGATGAGADAGGSLDPALCALVGTATGRD